MSQRHYRCAPLPLLKFGEGWRNGKLRHLGDRRLFTFSLPAGWSCPFADACLAKTDPETGRVQDGPRTEFRCYAASDEQIRPVVRRSRWHNYAILKSLSRRDMVRCILQSLPAAAATVRLHVSGDFFSRAYFDAWVSVAGLRPDVLFYAYTKALRYWVARLDRIGDGRRPGRVGNFVLTASRGGKDDHLIGERGLRSAAVVKSEVEAALMGLPLDHDDSHAMRHGSDFALLVHGPQPAGSDWAKAIAALRARGEFGYGKRADARRPLKTIT